MEKLFENEYMQIGRNPVHDILEIKSKKVCDDVIELDNHIAIIIRYVKDTQSKKIIFNLNNMDYYCKESLLYDKLVPSLGENGVKSIAAVTGKNEKVKTLLSELGAYLSPVEKQFHIIGENFETYQDAFQWIISEL
jgi:hypothetical protein